MALMPSYQFHPRNTFFVDSFQSSVSNFHLRGLQLFGYSPSVQSKKQFRCGVLERGWSDSRAPGKKQHKRFNLLRKDKKDVLNMSGEAPISWSTNGGVALSRSSWLENWDVTRHNNVDRKPQAVMNYRNRGDVSGSDAEEGTSTSTGGSTMQRIVEKLKKFGYMDDVNHQNDEVGRGIEKGSIDNIFYVEEGLLPNSRGGFSQEFPFGDNSVVSRGDGKVRFPWERNETNEQKSTLDSRKTRSLAEMTLPELEISRLRNLALRTKTKMRITGAGVTQQAVETIHEKWKTSEVVRLKVEGPPALNMKRMHGILEIAIRLSDDTACHFTRRSYVVFSVEAGEEMRKTGGLVIWRSGTSVSLYRGVTYEDPQQKLKKRITRKSEFSHEFPSSTDKTGQYSPKFLTDADASQSGSISYDPECETSSPLRYEDEVDKLLDSLGPRYEDWPGDGPLPVDADLLPQVVTGYQPPFRLLPYGVRSTLGSKEATALRRLARGLPPHFALGRSRQHQGLAVAVVKLWERSSIAKIALKRGVQLTTSERMAEDLKRLTGGMLLSANKEYLVYYRGKDFLSPDVAEALLEKETLAKALQDEEEQARLRASALVAPSQGLREESATAGSLKETLEADTRWGKPLDDDHKEKMMREAELLRHADLVRKLESKLAFAERKLTKAERALSKVESCLNPADRAEDYEALTDEERFMFRKLGLRMKAFLLLGRRGVFDGTVENMHLHWKYRELVKIIVKAPTIEEVKNIAIALEAESGGILVSVDKISKGYAIVIFRGRDYKRPPLLRPKNLLTKRKALARSIELQRRQAILTHISSVEARVHQLRSEIEQMATVKERGDEELYNKLNSAYSTEDEDSEEEEEEEGSYPEIYDSQENIVDENEDLNHNSLETNFPYDSQENLETWSSRE